MNKRKVNIYRQEFNKESKKYEKVFVEQGVFHEFGCDFEETDNGPGNYSTAIIEMPDGTISNVYLLLVKFCDE